MANELTMAGSLVFDDGVVDPSPGMSYTNQFDSPSSLLPLRGRLSVGTTTTAIPLGSLTTLGWAMFKNLDGTNSIHIQHASGGTKILKIAPGKTVGPLYLGDGITAPYAIADTAACLLDYEIYAR